MSEQHFVLGIDGGTESIRASVFDLRGNQISCFSSAYETLYPHSSWAEQRAEDWVEVCLVFSSRVNLQIVFVDVIIS
jgi:sugar (pentulose or hexulose) kinase